MMKKEFEELANCEVSVEDYNMIEIVYMSHPLTESKADIVDLYKRFGMVLIKDMVPRSKEICILENRAQALRLELESLNVEIASLKN